MSLTKKREGRLKMIVPVIKIFGNSILFLALGKIIPNSTPGFTRAKFRSPSGFIHAPLK